MSTSIYDEIDKDKLIQPNELETGLEKIEIKLGKMIKDGQMVGKLDNIINLVNLHKVLKYCKDNIVSKFTK